MFCLFLRIAVALELRKHKYKGSAPFFIEISILQIYSGCAEALTRLRLPPEKNRTDGVLQLTLRKKIFLSLHVTILN